MDISPLCGDGSEPLGRLLSQETNVANLLAYLSERDPSPLLAAFDLSATQPTIKQEVSQGITGRFDAVITDNDQPIALVELKVAAKQHGNQYGRYDEWSKNHGNVPCHLVTLDDEVPDAPSHWDTHLLTELLDGWSISRDERARVFAAAARDALQDVLDQTAGPLGHANRTAVAIAFRHLDHRVRGLLPDIELTGGAERTSGGQPSVVFYALHPAGQSDRERLCVDLRSEARGPIWKLRLGVEVWLTHDQDGRVVPGSRDHARARAHDLAVAMGDQLRTSAFIAHLVEVGRPDLAAVFTSSRADGLLPGTPTQFTLDEWRNAAAAGTLTKGRRRLQPHPRFNHDDGRRLVSISHVDYREVTVDQLVVLVETALRYLGMIAATSTRSPAMG